MRTCFRSRVSTKVMSAVLALSILTLPVGCAPTDDPDAALQAFLNDTGGPPTPRPEDEVMKGKAKGRI